MKKRILLIAFEKDVLGAFPVALAAGGHEVSVARRGLLGLNQARSDTPDLVVIDTVLPDMDGPTAEGILRRLPSTACIPILLLKPRAHRLMPSDLARERLETGAAQCLDVDHFVRQVEELLARTAPPFDRMDLGDAACQPQGYYFDLKEARSSASSQSNVVVF